MKILIGYVKIATDPRDVFQRAILQKVVEFCSEYLANAKIIGIPSEVEVKHDMRSGLNVITIDYEKLSEAHFYDLQNTTNVETFIDEHLKFL